VPECLDYAIDGDGETQIVAEDFGGIYPVFRYVGSGGMTLGGATPVTRPSGYVGSGGMTLGGSAVVRSQNYHYAGSGGLRLGGSSTIVSTNYHYTGSGGITLGGSAGTASPFQTYVASGGAVLGGAARAYPVARFKPTGQGPSAPSYSGISLGGAATASVKKYRYTGSGGIRLGGSATRKANYWKCTGSGGVSLGGQAAVTSPIWKYTGSGGITLGGFVLPHFIGSGGFRLGGSAVVNSLRYRYLTSGGGVKLGGSAPVRATAYHYTGSGGVRLGGSARAFTNFYDLVDEWAMDSDAEDIQAVFSTAPAGPDTLVPITATQNTDCRCSLPNVLQWNTNLPDTRGLGEFLGRNNLSMPNAVTVAWSKNANAWQYNMHLTGVGDTGIQEKWDVLYEWACVGGVGTLTVTTSNTMAWKLAVSVLKRAVDNSYSQRTRLMLELNSDSMCQIPSQFSFSCLIDTSTNSFQPLTNYAVSADLMIIKDDIGLFGGRWTLNPQLTLAVQALPFPPDNPTLDLTAMLPENQ
ncbi:MAG: hypothetical protein ACREGR_00690, partial [Minisyncoccia bacterium]